MENQGGFVDFRVVTEKIKENRQQGLMGLYGDSALRYALFDNRPKDWDQITRREKIFSQKHIKGPVRGSYTFLTSSIQDEAWPFNATGAAKEGDSDYNVYTIQFIDGNVRMVRGKLHAGLALPGQDTEPAKVHGTERELLPTLAELLNIPKTDSLFNKGFKPALDKSKINLPGTDFLTQRYQISPDLSEEVSNNMELKRQQFKALEVPWTADEAKASVLLNLQKIFTHGNLGGTGYLSILPVDQDIEHSVTTFTGNPEYADPIKLMNLAITGGTNAIALSLGALEVVSSRDPELLKKMPVIAKINHGQLLSAPNKARQRMYGGTPKESVDAAYKNGATAIGITIYYGLPEEEFAEELAAGSEAAARAHELGLPVIIWSYLRNPDFKKSEGDMHTASDLTAQANRLASATGADIIKQKLPERDKGFAAVKTGQQDPKYYDELVTGHAVDLARAQVWANHAGQRPLINSGGAATGKGLLADAGDAVYTAVVNVLAGGTGLIMGRKAFQKELPEGSYLIKLIQGVYLLAVPEEKLTPQQKKVLEEVGGSGLHEKYHPMIARLAVNTNTSPDNDESAANRPVTDWIAAAFFVAVAAYVAPLSLVAAVFAGAGFIWFAQKASNGYRDNRAKELGRISSLFAVTDDSSMYIHEVAGMRKVEETIHQMVWGAKPIRGNGALVWAYNNVFVEMVRFAVEIPMLVASLVADFIVAFTVKTESGYANPKVLAALGNLANASPLQLAIKVSDQARSAFAHNGIEGTAVTAATKQRYALFAA